MAISFFSAQLKHTKHSIKTLNPATHPYLPQTPVHAVLGRVSSSSRVRLV